MVSKSIESIKKKKHEKIFPSPPSKGYNTVSLDVRRAAMLTTVVHTKKAYFYHPFEILSYGTH